MKKKVFGAKFRVGLLAAGVALIFGFLFFLRFYDLTLDSFSYDDYGTSWFDEGYIHNARNMALFGSWTLEGDLWNPMYISPVYTVLEFISFSIFGVSTFSMRLVPALLGALSIILAGLLFMLKKSREALVYSLLLGGNIMLFSFGRIAMIESVLLFFIILSLGLINYNSKCSWIATGFFIPFLFFSKITSIFFILAIPISLLGYYWIYRSKETIKNLVWLISGSIASAFLWMLWLIPNLDSWKYANFAGYGSRVEFGLVKIISSFLFFLKFSLLNQLIIFFSLLAVLACLFVFFKKKRIPFMDFLIIVSIALFLLQITFADYPLRRFLLVVPIILLATTRFICSINKITLIFTESRMKVSSNRFITIFLAVYLFINLAYMGVYFSPLASGWDNNHVIASASEKVGEYIPPGEKVYGYYAVSFAAENKIKPYYSRSNIDFANTEEVIMPMLKSGEINYAVMEANLSDFESSKKKNADVGGSLVYTYVKDNFEVIGVINIKDTRYNYPGDKIYVYKRKNCSIDSICRI